MKAPLLSLLINLGPSLIYIYCNIDESVVQIINLNIIMNNYKFFLHLNIPFFL